MVVSMERHIGSRIIEVMESLSPGGSLTVRRGTEDGDQVFEIVGDRCRVEVRVNPVRWLGLSFALSGDRGPRSLLYDIDTDLYDVSQPKNREFALEIEDEISDFLEALVNCQITVRESGGKLAIVVPVRGGFRRIERGRVFTTSKDYDQLAKAQAGESFGPLLP